MCLGIVSGGLGHLDPWILSWSQLLESPGYAGALSVSVRGCPFHRTERKLLRWLGGHDERLGCAPRGPPRPPVGLEPARRGRKGGTNMMDSHFETEVVLLAVTTAGGPTHGGAKMTGGRSPPQFCFSLSWLDIYGSTNLRTASVLDDATTGQSIPAPMPLAYLFPPSPNL